jgi:hypothetical protein
MPMAWPRPPSNPGTLWQDPAIAPPYVGLWWWVPPWASPWHSWGRPWPCPPVVGRRHFIAGRDFETGRELEIDVFFPNIAWGRWPWHIWGVIAGGRWHIWGVRAGGRWHENPRHFFFQIWDVFEFWSKLKNYIEFSRVVSSSQKIYKKGRLI